MTERDGPAPLVGAKVRCFERVASEYLAKEEGWGTVPLTLLFRDEARQRVREEGGIGKVPPWRTLRGWASDVLKARLHNQPMVDLESRWVFTQRRVTGLCSKGKHLMVASNIYRRTVRDKRTSTGYSMSIRCKACKREQANAYAKTYQRKPTLKLSDTEAADASQLLTRSDAWLGRRVKSFLLQLIKTELVPKEKS